MMQISLESKDRELKGQGDWMKNLKEKFKVKGRKYLNMTEEYKTIIDKSLNTPETTNVDGLFFLNLNLLR